MGWISQGSVGCREIRDKKGLQEKPRMQLFPPSLTLLCIASLYIKYPFSDGDQTFVMYCTTYDLATTGQRKLDKKLEIQNNFGLKTVQCI